MPKYEVYDAQNQLLFKIEGDCCYCKCCTDVRFPVSPHQNMFKIVLDLFSQFVFTHPPTLKKFLVKKIVKIVQEM